MFRTIEGAVDGMRGRLYEEGIRGRVVAPWNNFAAPSANVIYLSNASFEIEVNSFTIKESSGEDIISAMSEIVVGDICPGMSWRYHPDYFNNEAPTYTLSQQGGQSVSEILRNLERDLDTYSLSEDAKDPRRLKAIGCRRYVTMFFHPGDHKTSERRPCALALQFLLLPTDKGIQLYTTWFFRSFNPDFWMSFDMKVAVAIHHFFNQQLKLNGGRVGVLASFFHSFEQATEEVKE